MILRHKKKSKGVAAKTSSNQSFEKERNLSVINKRQICSIYLHCAYIEINISRDANAHDHHWKHAHIIYAVNKPIIRMKERPMCYSEKKKK